MAKQEKSDLFAFMLSRAKPQSSSHVAEKQPVSRKELSDGWDPSTDKRLTVWQTTQHLIHTLEHDGESAAASLLTSWAAWQRPPATWPLT